MKQPDKTLNIPFKANRILHLVQICLFIILLRIWHLAVVEYDQKLEESRRSQRRVTITPAKRGTIEDRFGIPLAFNKLQYNLAILYTDIRQIPSITWEKNSEGKREKHFKRKEYIASLAELLGKELAMDEERIEDLIHAKAALYNHLPFIIKENLSEREYYRLKMFQKDWPGIFVQLGASRVYPQGKVGGDVIGYMGAINRAEYEAIIQEIKALEIFLQITDAGEMLPFPGEIESLEEAQQRLKELEELAYSMNDFVGKAGVEKQKEQELKGFRGKRNYASDAHGHFLKELPDSRSPVPGKKITLTLSTELQEYAEKLLIDNEKIRQPIMSHLGPEKRNVLADKQPWMKGGAIVAMDPNTGEILALATYPRFDPNDFIRSTGFKERQKHLTKWLESETYLASLWNRQRPLERETSNNHVGIYVEELPLTWINYLNFVLSNKTPLRKSVLIEGTIKDAVQVQRSMEFILSSSTAPPQDILDSIYNSEGETSLQSEALREAKHSLDPYFVNIQETEEKLLLTDLLRIAIPADRFSDTLLSYVGKKSISAYREENGAFITLYHALQEMCKPIFHDEEFKTWRAENEKSFLKEKREREAALKTYSRPYIDYLDSEEKKMFNLFWEENQWRLLLSLLKPQDEDGDDVYTQHLHKWVDEYENGAHRQAEWATAYTFLKEEIASLPEGVDKEYLQTFREFRDLSRPLFGKYRSLRTNTEGVQLEKDLAAAFYPRYGFGYGRSQAYRQATTQGSIFKLVTAYEAMTERYHTLEECHGDLQDLNPLTICDKVWRKGKAMYVGYNSDGTPIPRYYKGGRMPKSLSHNIGEIDVKKALATSSNPYFAILAGDIIQSPENFTDTARQLSYGSRTGIELPGEISGSLPDDLDYNRTGLHAFSIGQHTLVATPLQTSVMLAALANGGKILKPTVLFGEGKIKREIFLPEGIQKILLEGMSDVVERTQRIGFLSLSRMYNQHPEAISDYLDMKRHFIGKTSTSESVENIDLDPHFGTNIYTHVWFGGISYKKNVIEEAGHEFLFRNAVDSPELVVVVYLRYGGYGKEAAPVAAQVAKKWKEIYCR